MVKIPSLAQLIRRSLRAVRAATGGTWRRLRQQRQAGPHRSFRLTRTSELPRYQQTANWWRLWMRSNRLLWRARKTVGLLVLTYVAISWLIAGAATVKAFESIKQVVAVFQVSFIEGLAESAVSLVSGATTAGQSAAAQLLLIIINLLFWLGFIWLARHTLARKKTSARETMYLSGTALVPTVLLFGLVVLQLIPLLVASVLLGTIGFSWTIDTAAQNSLLAVMSVLLAIFSLYFLASSFVALLVVALPGMYPWQALKQAKRMVTGRRFAIVRKIAAIPLFVGFTSAAILLMAVLFDNWLCGGPQQCLVSPVSLPTLSFVVTALAIASTSTYAYVLYRALLESRE